MLEIMDTYSGGWSILFIAIFECISVGWIYGKVLFLLSTHNTFVFYHLKFVNIK